MCIIECKSCNLSDNDTKKCLNILYGFLIAIIGLTSTALGLYNTIFIWSATWNDDFVLFMDNNTEIADNVHYNPLLLQVSTIWCLLAFIISLCTVKPQTIRWPFTTY